MGFLLACLLCVQKPTATEIGLLVAANLTILADASLTLDIKNHPDLHESNPLLGQNPSDAKIIFVGGFGAVAGTTLVWFLLPPPWRAYFSVFVLAVELHATFLNMNQGLRFRVPF